MIDFCKNIFPEIRKLRAETKLVIVGANPSSAIKRLAEQPGVSVTGSVPDVRPYVRKSALMIAPLTIARGTQNKILEAMAMGVPTVTSEIAAKGVDAIPGEHLLAGSRPDDYVRAIRRLLDHPDERKKFATRSRERMLSNHDWSASMRRMDGIISRCLRRVHGSAKANELVS
jgi:hypothetical protein